MAEKMLRCDRCGGEMKPLQNGLYECIECGLVMTGPKSKGGPTPREEPTGEG